MRVFSSTSPYTKRLEPSDGLRREFHESLRAHEPRPLEVLKSKLASLPRVLFSEDDNVKHVVCDTTSPLYKRQVDEYADLDKLAAMIDLARQADWPAVMSRNVEDTCALYDRLKQDLETRFWFLTHENKAIKDSFTFWNASAARKKTASILAVFIVYKRALSMIEDYRSAFKHTKNIVDSHRDYMNLVY